MKADENANLLVVEEDTKNVSSSDTDEDVDDNMKGKLKNFQIEKSKIVELVEGSVDETELCEHILKLGDPVTFEINHFTLLKSSLCLLSCFKVMIYRCPYIQMNQSDIGIRTTLYD